MTAAPSTDQAGTGPPDTPDLVSSTSHAFAEESSTEGAPPALTPSPATPRRRAGLWPRLGIQSKLLAMLLGVSIVSILATGLISYRLASTALTQAAKDKVIAVGDARLKQITAAEASLRTNTILNSTGIAQDARRDFEAGYQTLNQKPVAPADRAAVEKYHQNVFVPNLALHVNGEVAPQAFYPRRNAGWYLQGVADAIPGQLPGSRPDVSFVGAGRFTTSFTLGTFAAAGEARAQFQLRLWYAARRANIALERADIWKDESADDVLDLLRQAASRLHVEPEQLDELAPRLDLERFAPGEVIDQLGRVPNTVRWIADGRSRVTVPYGRTGSISPLTLARGDLTGLTALTQQPSAYTCIAATELTMLTVPVEVLDDLARYNVRLARDIGQDIDRGGQQLAAAVVHADRQLTTSSTSPSSPPATAGIVRR